MECLSWYLNGLVWSDPKDNARKIHGQRTARKFKGRKTFGVSELAITELFTRLMMKSGLSILTTLDTEKKHTDDGGGIA